MLCGLMGLFSLCCRSSDVAEEGREGLLRYRDLGRHAFGEFSTAIVQGNQVLEDQSQIESGPFGTFVGVYDGHGGAEAARYVRENIFQHFKRFLSDAEVMSPAIVDRAIQETEDGFTALVSERWTTKPQMATVGSCCLVGVICQRTLHVANLGDSRVVLGKYVGREIAAIQLSTEHNANQEAVRQELKAMHPDDPQIVILKHGVWRIKGIIQVSRSIGDVYLKHPQFSGESINGKFKVPEPVKMPVLTANPSIVSLNLRPCDSFLIFASDGLWEHLSNEKAVEIVHGHPTAGSAKRLVKAALQEAARKREMRYADLRKIDRKVRRHFHDDITVIVLFLNHDLISRGTARGSPVSVHSALEH
ncbi:unnamed protein product [Victoria cruziana]